MKRIIVSVIAVAIVAAAAVGLIQRERSILRAYEGRVRRAEASAKQAARASFLQGSNFGEPFGSSIETLRDEYVEQQRAKAMLLDEVQLRSALEQTNTEIRELEAQKSLEEVTATLAGIADQYEGTRAAPIAVRMLEAARHLDEPEVAPAEAADAEEAF